ncbi:External alternative NAD(P)H-ubiquinone oxidoreductase B1, partial [Durusdinium trenchii]
GASDEFPQLEEYAQYLSAVVDEESNPRINAIAKEFKGLLERIDANLQPFPPTAQVAAQQGKYLSSLFNQAILDGDIDSFTEVATASGPFTYFHKGSLAYLGGGSAAFDLPVIGPITGPAAGVAWKLYETSAQLSWKNRALVGLDWLRGEVFGRDTSRIA